MRDQQGAEPERQDTSVLELRLESEPDAPRRAREAVRAAHDQLDPNSLDDVELVVSELVTNAVRHGEPEIRFRVRFQPFGVDVAVTDHAASLPPSAPGRPDETASSGRGLAIVEQIADEWGVEPLDSEPGKTVWASVRGRGDDPHV